MFLCRDVGNIEKHKIQDQTFYFHLCHKQSYYYYDMCMCARFMPCEECKLREIKPNVELLEALR